MSTLARGRAVIRDLVLLPVRAYQRGISPYTPPACRYYPVCSQYAVDAVQRHGAAKGALLASARILRCNPLSRGGVDLVPAPGTWSNPRGVPSSAVQALPLSETPTDSRHIA